VRILIVEDQASSRRLLRAVLATEGHEVLEATDGRAALDILARTDVDAVVSDLLMPGMDGFQLCAQVRSHDTPTRRLPLIVISGTYVEPEDRKLADAIGADAFLEKPLSASLLLTTLREMRERAPSADTPRPPLEDRDALRLYSERLEQKLGKKLADLESAMQVSALRREELDEARRRLRESEDARRHLDQSMDAAVAKQRAEVVRGLRHSIRQPLNVILGFAEFLASGKAGPMTTAQAEYVRDIVEAGQQLLQYTDAEFATVLPAPDALAVGHELEP
jgi:CheY-like chemotaxis protein